MTPIIKTTITNSIKRLQFQFLKVVGTVLPGTMIKRGSSVLEEPIEFVEMTCLGLFEVKHRAAARTYWPTGSPAQVSEPLTSLAEHPLVLLSTH